MSRLKFPHSELVHELEKLLTDSQIPLSIDSLGCQDKLKSLITFTHIVMQHFSRDHLKN
jgi:hypothetical protein